MSSHLKGPNEGNWSVFAEKVVGERDEALASLAFERVTVAELKLEAERWAVRVAASNVEAQTLRADLAKAQARMARLEAALEMQRETHGKQCLDEHCTTQIRTERALASDGTEVYALLRVKP